MSSQVWLVYVRNGLPEKLSVLSCDMIRKPPLKGHALSICGPHWTRMPQQYTRGLQKL